MPRLTVERVRELLDYDPETGLLTWRCQRGPRIAGDHAGGICPLGYIQIMVDGHNYRAHRLAWLLTHGTWPTKFIDHLNGIRDDNRLENLRDAPRFINQQNMRSARSDNSTGVLGVSWDSRAKNFRAQIRVSGKHTYIGGYSTPEEAHQAYLEAKRRLHPGNTL